MGDLIIDGKTLNSTLGKQGARVLRHGGDKDIHKKCSSKNLNERDNLGDIFETRIKLKWILDEDDESVNWTHMSQNKIRCKPFCTG